MRNWILKKFKGVREEDFQRLYQHLVRQDVAFKEVIERHKMQGAWEQIKQERKQRVVH